MTFDLLTIMTMTAVVVVVAGAVFLVETAKHRESAAGRIWAVAFLSGILTTVCYLAWAVDPDSWVAVALGNAGFVSSAGCMWLGCRRFNRKGLRIAAPLVGAAVVASFVATLVEGPAGGDWAGSIVTFPGIGAFGVLGAIETRLGRMSRQIQAIGLTVVLALQGLYFLVRTVVFAVSGPGSELFQLWFGTVTTSFITVILTVVAVVAMSVMRAGESGFAAARGTVSLSVSEGGFLLPGTFELAFGTAARRAERAGVPVGVIAMRIDDLPQIVAAYGTTAAERIVSAWRASVSHSTPPASILGEAGPSGILIGFHPSSAVEAQRIAAALHRRVVADLMAAETVVTPVVAAGLAVSDGFGYDAAALVAAADEAASRSVTSSDASVVVADGLPGSG